MSFAIGGFADLWLYSEPDFKSRARKRDESTSVVANFACPVCGAPAGDPCSRSTVAGRAVIRRVPHFGRNSSGPPKNRPRLPSGMRGVRR